MSMPYASFYGFPPPGTAALDRIDAPGLIFFGEHENAFSVPDAQAFVERQRRSGKHAEVVVSGAPSELICWVYGRQSVAAVTVRGK